MERRDRLEEDGEARAAAILGAWLDRGAPEDDPPDLPPGLPPGRLGVIYERHLLRGRRARGAYYTPPALVGPLVEAVLPRGGAGGLVLDPACGAGAFLLAAAERLGPAPAALDRLEGIDSDAGAVAVARLALARLCGAPLHRVRVRCSDALRDQALGPVDAVLGNPPFLGEEHHGALFASLRGSRVGPYLQPRTDLSYVFGHLCLDLLRPGGLLGLVLPEGLLHADGASLLRRRLLQEARLESLTLVELPALFPAARGQRVCLLALRKGPAPAHRPRVLRLDSDGLRLLHRAAPQRALLRAGALRLAAPSAEALCAHLERAGTPLRDSYSVDTGVQAGPGRLSARDAAELGAEGARGVFVLADEELAALGLSEAERALLRPFYPAAALPPLGPLPPPRHWLLYLTPATCPDLDPFPALARHLGRFRPLLERRRETRLGRRAYFHLHWPRREALFERAKLLSVRQAPRPRVAYAPQPAFVDLAVNVITPRRPGAAFSLPALSALLNAVPARHYLAHRGKRKGPLCQIDGAPLSALPLPPYDLALERALCALAAQVLEDPRDPAPWREIDSTAAAAFGLSAAVLSDL